MKLCTRLSAETSCSNIWRATHAVQRGPAGRGRHGESRPDCKPAGSPSRIQPPEAKLPPRAESCRATFEHAPAQPTRASIHPLSVVVEGSAQASRTASHRLEWTLRPGLKPVAVPVIAAEPRRRLAHRRPGKPPPAPEANEDTGSKRASAPGGGICPCSREQAAMSGQARRVRRSAFLHIGWCEWGRFGARDAATRRRRLLNGCCRVTQD